MTAYGSDTETTKDGGGDWCHGLCDQRQHERELIKTRVLNSMHELTNHKIQDGRIKQHWYDSLWNEIKHNFRHKIRRCSVESVAVFVSVQHDSNENNIPLFSTVKITALLIIYTYTYSYAATLTCTVLVHA